MAMPTSFWSESWRVLAYSAAAALAFVALEKVEFALLDLAGADRVVDLTRSRSADDRLAAEARELAARSRSVGAALPPNHRVAAFRLGYEIGWASEFTGSFAMSEPQRQAQAAAIADAHVRRAHEQARVLGLDPAAVALLPSRTLADFVRLQERFEADENGLAARVEARLTPIHRHLFLLGATVGNDAAKVQGSGGKMSGAQVDAIRRHATLAGITPSAWQPLVVDHRREAPAAVLDRHRSAVDALTAALSADDALASPASSPR